MELANRAERIRRRAWLSRDVRAWHRLMALAAEVHTMREPETDSGAASRASGALPIVALAAFWTLFFAVSFA